MLVAKQLFDSSTEALEVEKCDLRVSDLRKSYGELQVLDGVSLSIRHGERIALLGKNGSGKSTLLRTVMGLTDNSSGSIDLLGENIAHARRDHLRELRSKVGFVFQKHNLVPRLSALSNVVHGELGKHSSPAFWFQGTAPKASREKALHVLDLVGLADLAARRADQLSGGQSQRVAIARALMQEPDMLLADEPVASLDPQAGEDVMKLLESLSIERGMTLIFSTHHLSHACEYAERIVALKSGKVELDANLEEVNVANLRKLYE